MRQIAPRHAWLIMHSQHVGVMLIGPGSDGPVPFAGKRRQIARSECRQGGAINREQVRHSLSVTKTDQGDQMAAERKNPASHGLNRSDPWRDVGQRGFAFCDPLLDRSDFETLHFERWLQLYETHHFLLVITERR